MSDYGNRLLIRELGRLRIGRNSHVAIICRIFLLPILHEGEQFRVSYEPEDYRSQSSYNYLLNLLRKRK